MFQEVLKQVQEVENFVRNLQKDTEKKMKKSVCSWTYEKREKENKEFIYWSVLNAGLAGETLAMSAKKSQKLFTTLQNLSVICDFKTNKVIFSITEVTSTGLRVVYNSEIIKE